MKKPLNIAITILLPIIAIYYGVLRPSIRLMMTMISMGHSPFDPDIWLVRWECFAALLAFILFVIRVVLTIREGKGALVDLNAEFGGRLGQLLERQKGWVLEWCAAFKQKNVKEAYGMSAAILAFVILCGLYANRTTEAMLYGYVPMGLFWAQVGGIFMWALGYSRTKPNKILRKQGNNLQKAAGEEGNPETVFENLLEAGEESLVLDQDKKEMIQVTVGSRYWLRLCTYGRVELVEAEKVERIRTEVSSYTTGRGVTRTVWYDYIARFDYRDSKPKKSGDRSFVFHQDSTRSAFLELVKSQVGDRVTIETK